MKSFDQRVVVITGGASGIGRSLAVQLAGMGASLAIADMNLEGMAETRQLAENAGGRCTTHKLDVADREAFEAFARDVIAEHGEVHAVFNNAGVTLVDSVENQSYEDFNWLMNINFWGVVHGTRAFLPYLKQVDEAHIINVSSVFGILALPLQSAYNTSKFAVRGFTEALKMELAGGPIQVSCVHPGGIKTGIAQNSRMNEKTLGVPQEQLKAEFNAKARTTADQAAAIIIRGVMKNKRRILVGTDAKIMSLVTRLFPGSYEKLLGFEKGVRAKRKARLERPVAATTR
jgi:NAD(P)-dependent dehydrogenase (short-subunit alcohol dehydrogenase family)